MNNNNTKYKDSPLGKIPNDWEVVRISDYGKVYTGNTPPTNDLENYGFEFLFVSPSDLGSDKYILNTEKKLSKKGFSISRKFPSGSVLFTCIGSTIGKAGVASVELTSNQQINAIVVDEKYSNEFLYYALNHNADKIKLLAGEQAVPILNKSQFESVRIICPPLPEQKAIANILSLMDAVINKNNQLIAKKELQKKWLMQNLLTGKKRLLNDELGIINYELKQVFFGNFCRVSKGKAISAKNISNGIYPVIAGGQTSPYSHNQFTHENIITVSASGAYAGFVAFHGNKIWASDCSVIEEIENVSNIHYLYYFLKFKQELIYSLQAGGAQPHVFPKDIYNLSFIIHNSIEEQTAIAQVLQAADKEIQLLKTKTEKLREQKKGLMQVLLTGKKRLVIN